MTFGIEVNNKIIKEKIVHQLNSFSTETKN